MIGLRESPPAVKAKRVGRGSPKALAATQVSHDVGVGVHERRCARRLGDPDGRDGKAGRQAQQNNGQQEDPRLGHANDVLGSPQGPLGN